MRVLFCAAPGTMLKGMCGGVLKEMRLREESLTRLGHSVEFLPFDESPDWRRYDLCHLFSANGNTYGIGAAIKAWLPLVVSPIIDRVGPNLALRMGVWVDKKISSVFTHIGRCAELCRLADVVCLRSQEEQSRLKHGLGVTTPSRIARCPIDVEIAEPDEGRFAEYINRPFLLFLGDAANTRKNVTRLIQAIKGLDIELLIGGMISKGMSGDRVRALAGSIPNVRLIGVVTEGEKAFLLARSRVFVLPSLMEGIGLAAVEAALFGTTVVITRNGGPPDYFGDQVYYVEPYSVSDIRNKIRQALAQPRDASNWIRQNVSLDKTGKELLDCYSQALHQRKAEGV